MAGIRLRLLCVLGAVVLVCGVAIGQSAQTGTVYSVKDFGAVADGKTKCTDAVKKAIETAVKAGGGTVFFPAGEFLTGPIHLQSKITLSLDAGCVLKFSTDFNDYLPMVKSRWEGVECNNFSPQIYAYEANDIAIIGRGVIEGQGKVWWDAMRRAAGPQSELAKYIEMFRQNNKEAIQLPYFRNRNLFLRPPMIQLVSCRRVRIEGVKLQNPPFWTCNPVYCEDMVITGLSIKNPGNSPNTDGINPDSCKNVHISDCHISVGDDCITIKSGRDEDGRRVGKPCENITVTNCTMLDGHGGVVIGSEMSGGVKKVTITNCVFDGTDRGIRLKTSRNRGGVMEDITVSNIMMNNVGAGPIHLDMFYERNLPAGPITEKTPAVRNLYFSNIIVRNAKSGGFMLGIEEMPVQNVSFSDIFIEAETGFSCKDAKGVTFRNVRIDTKKGPALVCENTERLDIAGLTTGSPLENTPVIDLLNAKSVYVHDCWAWPNTGTFLRLRGDKSKGVTVQGNQLGQAKSAVVMEEGFPAAEAKQQ
jgi:polygalacturonase